MNTNLLKSFAQQTRLRLIKSVTDKLKYVLNSDSAILRDYATSIEKLKKDISQIGEDALIDKVAYTWFNRLMALRFMDANDYQPLQIKIVSPVEGYTQPEILNEATQGRIHEDLKIDRQKVNDLLDGRISVAIPENEVYRMLLISSCNHLSNLFPFLFEKIDDYTELLLPDDLTSELSIINDFNNGMTEEDCENVEILGWLYQFYISELNGELISSKKVYKKNELAPASQLFTPKWIVQYMVDNTLGQLWCEISPDTSLTKDLEFYIEPQYKDIVSRERKSVEKITFFEPCVGSGHILVYAFDLFYKMYEEEGYPASEIPFLILKNNLFGIDIDPRAAQIASFTLLMKARGKYRRFFRKIEQEHFVPNVYYYEDFEEDEKFNNATALGSLINVSQKDVESIHIEENTLFSGAQQKLKELYNILARKYDVVVTNPPYISSSRLEPSLKEYVNENYSDTKSDLFATFIIRCLELTNEDGLTGYMTPFVWMFISSYQKLRENIINNHFINNLIQLEYSGFDGATVPICTFTLRNKSMDAEGSYIRLSDFRGSENQAPKTLEAINNPNCGWFYTKNQKDFNKIPGSNIGYWASEKFISSFVDNSNLSKFFSLAKGMDTGKNDLFIRLWYECSKDNSAFNLEDNSKTFDLIKWVPYRKGGEYRKWFGNNDYLINWERDGFEVRNYKKSNIRNAKFFFHECISWTLLSSSFFGVRYYDKGGVFDANGSSLFLKTKKRLDLIIPFLSSKISYEFLKVINPTLAFQKGNLENIPINKEIFTLSNENVTQNQIKIARQEWNSRETSWDFTQSELIRTKYDIDNFEPEEGMVVDLANSDYIEAVLKSYCNYWTDKFFELHSNEEVLNAQFIEIYGLQDELTPDVSLDDITILRDELIQRELKEIAEEYKSGWELVDNKWELSNQKPLPVLPFNEKELIMQFISYAVGCMFGRYSLDKEGLILANQGETLENFLSKIGKDIEDVNFKPDEDNIIPVLDEEWFEDDIASRVSEFVKVVFGVESHQTNIDYIEKVLGKSLRAYMYRDFYTDHIKRYKKRPIYWMISSPTGSFQALIYMHRYNEDTISNVLNYYLRPYIDKLESHIEYLNHLVVEGTQREKTQATKDIVRVEKVIDELRTYDKDVLYPLALERVSIDLDDGVLVNYNKFGGVLKTVAGLNDTATKKKVKKFDWIDVSEIR